LIPDISLDNDPGSDWAMGDHAWAELGIREVGHVDFNPTFGSEGAGIWLATDFDELWEGGIPVAHNTFDPDPPGSPTLDTDDKLILQKAGGHGEGDYNLPSTPPSPVNNHRDDATSGTAYMTINGLDQGFETDGNWNTIELTPAGMIFTGDMTKMQVFYGIYGYGATHSVSFEDITVEGCGYLPVNIDIKPQSCPNPFNVKSKGVFPVAILGTEDFDVTQVDPASIRLEGVAPLRWALEDVATPKEDDICNPAGEDGYTDLTLKFKTQEVVAALGDVSDGDVLVLTLTGNLLGGTSIVGEDVILIIKKGK